VVGAQTTPGSSLRIFGFFKVPDSVVLALILVLMLHWVAHAVHGLIWGNEAGEKLQIGARKNRKDETDRGRGRA
jgi:hypothetical protein